MKAKVKGYQLFFPLFGKEKRAVKRGLVQAAEDWKNDPSDFNLADVKVGKNGIYARAIYKGEDVTATEVWNLSIPKWAMLTVDDLETLPDGPSDTPALLNVRVFASDYREIDDWLGDYVYDLHDVIGTCRVEVGIDIILPNGYIIETPSWLIIW